jgi:hypothetical protein
MKRTIELVSNPFNLLTWDILEQTETGKNKIGYFLHGAPNDLSPSLFLLSDKNPLSVDEINGLLAAFKSPDELTVDGIATIIAELIDDGLSPLQTSKTRLVGKYKDESDDDCQIQVRITKNQSHFMNETQPVQDSLLLIA